MSKQLILLSLAATFFTYSCSLLANSTQKKVITTQNIMPSNTDVVIKSITLKAREEKRAATGETPNLNRSIGFADVFLTIENNKEASTNLVIEKIQIQDTINGRLQLVKQEPKEISLKPLENSVNDFHLNNKTGYPTRNQVKAIVTYRIGAQVGVMESSPVNVDRL